LSCYSRFFRITYVKNVKILVRCGATGTKVPGNINFCLQISGSAACFHRAPPLLYLYGCSMPILVLYLSLYVSRIYVHTFLLSFHSHNSPISFHICPLFILHALLFTAQIYRYLPWFFPYLLLMMSLVGVETSYIEFGMSSIKYAYLICNAFN